MTWALGEAIADAAITYLSAQGATKFAAVEARHSDDIELPEPVAWRLSDPWTEPEGEFPVGFVIPERERPEIGPAGIARGFLNETMFTVVVIYRASVDLSGAGTRAGEVVRRMGLRYAVGTLEMLAEGRASMGYEWGLGARPEISYEPTYVTKDRSHHLSAILIRIGVMTSEGAL